MVTVLFLIGDRMYIYISRPRNSRKSFDSSIGVTVTISSFQVCGAVSEVVVLLLSNNDDDSQVSDFDSTAHIAKRCLKSVPFFRLFLFLVNVFSVYYSEANSTDFSPCMFSARPSICL